MLFDATSKEDFTDAGKVPHYNGLTWAQVHTLTKAQTVAFRKSEG